MGAMPTPVKIYHIAHIDNLMSIIRHGGLYSDADVTRQGINPAKIGMSKIKSARLTKDMGITPKLHVGECVPFYFCPRSVMLYMIHKRNPDLPYQGGQEQIIHLEARMDKAVSWAAVQKRRWGFTDRNAASAICRFFYDMTDLPQKIKWETVMSKSWSAQREYKQAEFLMEGFFAWELFDKIGVYSETQKTQVNAVLQGQVSPQSVEVERDWYY